MFTKPHNMTETDTSGEVAGGGGRLRKGTVDGKDRDDYSHCNHI